MTEAEMPAAGLVVHPSEKAGGRPIWVEERSLRGWQARKAILAGTHEQLAPFSEMGEVA